LLSPVFYLSIFLIFSFKSYSRDHKVSINIDGMSGRMVYLLSYFGEQQYRIDSMITDHEGTASFLFGNGMNEGMYRIQVDKDRGMDFLFIKKDVSLSIDKSFSLDSAKASGSEINEDFLRYIKGKKDYHSRYDLLEPLLYYYPENDPFYSEIESKARQLKDSYTSLIATLLDKHGRDLLATVIRFDQLQDIKPGELSPDETSYLKSHYFDSVDLNDTLILYTPILPVKVIDYLSLYIIPGASRDVQESAFIQAVDTLMKFTSGYMRIREMFINYMSNGFQAYGFEKVLTHLVENYMSDSTCVSQEESSKMQKRIEGFKKLAIGNTAPDFNALDIKGRKVQLSTIKAEYKLIIFWSGECPHCAEALPGLIKLYHRYRPELEVVAVSVDSDEHTWKTTVKAHDLDWINIAELKGWDGSIIKNYYVYATPTYLLLDKNDKIIAKPMTTKELRNELSKLLPDKAR
jgi:peroxiredoxin